MINEIFIVKNTSGSELEIKDFGIILDAGVSVELGEYDAVMLSDEVNTYIVNGDLVRVIEGEEISDIEKAVKITAKVDPYTIDYDNITWSSDNGETVGGMFDDMVRVSNTVLGTGYINEIPLTQTGLNTVRINSNSGYISNNGTHTYCEWSETDIDASVYSAGAWYIYVNRLNEIDIVNTKKDIYENIYLGLFFKATDNGGVGTVNPSNNILYNINTRLQQYTSRLGGFIIDDSGKVEVLGNIDGDTALKLFFPETHVQYSLDDSIQLECSTNDGGVKFFDWYNTDMGWARNHYIEVHHNGIVDIHSYNIPTNQRDIETSDTISFVDGSDTAATTSDLTSEINKGDYLHLITDGEESLIRVSSINSTTISFAPHTYHGSTATGLAHIDKTLTDIPDGKYTKHIIVRDYSSNVHMVTGTEIYDTKDEAASAEPPALPVSLDAGAIRMAEIIVTPNMQSLSGHIFDIRPLPFAHSSSNSTNSVSHDNLLNLNSDDHNQYLRTDGTRDITGKIKYAADENITDDKDIVNKKYADTKAEFNHLHNWSDIDKSGSTLSDFDVREASDIDMSLPNWGTNNVGEYITRSSEYLEDTQGSGRISPEIPLTGINTTTLTVVGGSGYVAYTGLHRKITWVTEDIDFSSYQLGVYYITVEIDSSIQIHNTHPGCRDCIYLGYVSWNGIISGLQQSGNIISDSLSRIIQFNLRLGFFIYDDGGKVSLMSGSTNKVVSSACKVQYGLTTFDLDEIDSDDAATYKFKYFYLTNTTDVLNAHLFARYSGEIQTDRWNDIDAVPNVQITGSCTFTNGSNIVTCTTDITSSVSGDNLVYLETDGDLHSMSVMDATWDGSQTTITLYDTYSGAGGTGTLIADYCLPRIPTGKFLKSMIIRTNDNQLVFTLGQQYHDSYEDALNAPLPGIPEVLQSAAIKIAYMVYGVGELDLTGKIFDIRPLPFTNAVGGQIGGGESKDTHSELLGLTSDDHPQYLKTDGLRNVIGILKYNSDKVFSDDNELVNKKYTDTEVAKKSDLVHTHTQDDITDLVMDADFIKGKEVSDGVVDKGAYVYNETTDKIECVDLFENVPIYFIDVYDAVGNQSISLGTWSDITFSDVRVNENFVFFGGGTEITIPKSDSYLLNAHISYDNLTATRTTSKMRIVVDSGSGYIEVPGSVSYGYNRNNTEGKDTLNTNILINLQEGDKVKLQASVEVGSSLITMPESCGLSIFLAKGIKGDKGESGEVTIQTEGIDVPNAPHNILNFKGSGLTTSDMGNGVVDLDFNFIEQLSAIQISTLTTQSLSSTWTDKLFETLDIETNSDILSLNADNKSIDIGSDGLYYIQAVTSIKSTSSTNRNSTRLYKNASTEIPGSYSEVNIYSGDAHNVVSTSVVSLSNGDSIRLQIQNDNVGSSNTINSVMIITKLEGVKGATGDSGVDGNDAELYVQNEGVSITGSPHNTLNFTGVNVDAVDAGNGIVDVNFNFNEILSSSQYRYSNTLSLTSSYQSIVFNEIDIESNIETIQQDSTNLSRINIKEDGIYVLTYTTNGSDEIQSRLLVNGVSEINGSSSSSGYYMANNNIEFSLSKTVLYQFTSGDYVELQSSYVIGTSTLSSNSILSIVKLDGVKGDKGEKGDQGEKGDAGSGSSIFVKDEGVDVPNTPFSTINFKGDLVDVADNGTDEVDVTINNPENAPVKLSFDGIPLGNTPHEIINIDSSNGLLQLSDNGDGSATISAIRPVYGTEFQYVESIGTTTTSARDVTWTNKVTMTTSNLPSGKYKIQCAYGWSHSSASSDIRIRCQLNGVNLSFLHNQETKDSTSVQYDVRVFYNDLSGINDITIDFQNESGSSTMFDTTIEIIRVQ